MNQRRLVQKGDNNEKLTKIQILVKKIDFRKDGVNIQMFCVRR